MAKKKNDDYLLGILLLLFLFFGKGLLDFILKNLPPIVVKNPFQKDKTPPPSNNTQQPTPTPTTQPNTIVTPIAQPTLQPYGIPTIETLKKVINDLPKKTPAPPPIQTTTPTPILPYSKPLSNPLTPTNIIKDVTTIGLISAPFLLPLATPLAITSIVSAKKTNVFTPTVKTTPSIQTQTTANKIQTLLNPIKLKGMI